MLSTSKRIFGIALFALTAGTAMATPAHAGDELIGDTQLPHELHLPLCVPSSGLGLPIVDALVPELTGCMRAPQTLVAVD
jgi:hypothetical protein